MQYILNHVSLFLVALLIVLIVLAALAVPTRHLLRDYRAKRRENAWGVTNQPMSMADVRRLRLLPIVGGGASTENYMSLPGLVASGTVTQYRAVKLSTAADRTVLAMTNANAERPIGILQNDPATTEAAELAILGACKAEYGGTVTRGDKLGCDNDGKLITDAEVSGGGTDLHHVAVALESGVSGDIRQVYVFPAELIGTE